MFIREFTLRIETLLFLDQGVDVTQHRLIFVVASHRSLLLRAAANLDGSCDEPPRNHYLPERIRTKLDNPKQAQPGLVGSERLRGCPNTYGPYWTLGRRISSSPIPRRIGASTPTLPI